LFYVNHYVYEKKEMPLSLCTIDSYILYYKKVLEVREIPLEGKSRKKYLNGKLTGKPAFQGLIPELYKMGKLKRIWKILPQEIGNLKRF